MSWETIRDQIKELADQAAEKINHSADVASAQAKLSAAKRSLEKAYTELGKAAYAHFVSDVEDGMDTLGPALKEVAMARREVAVRHRNLKAIKEGKPIPEETADAKNTDQKSSKPKQNEQTCTNDEDYSIDVNITSKSANSYGSVSVNLEK